jgi:hypothetical protein
MLLNKDTQNLLAYSILLYLITYDFLFFNLENFFNSKLFFLKIYFELIVLGLLTIYFIYAFFFLKVHKSVISITIFIFFSIIYAMILNNGIFAIAKDFRLFFLPIIISILFYYLKSFELIDIRKLLIFYIFTSIILLLYGFYEYILFDGTVDSIWRYEFLLQAKKGLDPDFLDHKVMYQVLRNGSIRVSSIFISALDYSFYVATFGILIFIMILKLKHTFFIPLFIVVLFSLYTAQVRTGFILLLLGILIYFLINSKIKVIYQLAFYMPFIAIMGTFLVMFSENNLNDTSTLGRLVQYYQMINEFTVFGSGMGKYAFNFDSLYIYIFLTYGVFSILFFYIQYWIINKLIIVNNNISMLNFNRYEIVLTQFMIIYHLISLYLFTFQHTLGAPTFFILYFFSFIILSKSNHKLRKEVI